MQVVLLHRVENLGQMGEVVTVKPGYARNFLIPRKKALRATKENLAYFEAQRKVLETANQNSKKDAESAAGKMKDVSVIIIRQAAESGKLYGSVSSRDVADALTEKGYKATRDQIELNQSIKDLGIFTAKITLHPEVTVTAMVNVARTEQEAQLQVERAKEPKKKAVEVEQPEVADAAAETTEEAA
jgi:large subunit ribosomal protein L9